MSKITIAFVLTYAGGLTATLLSDVSWGVMLYELHYFLNPVIRWWYHNLPDLRYSFIIALFIIISFALRSGKYSENRIGDIPHFKWLFIMLFFMGIGCFYAIWPERHRGYFINHGKLIVFIVIAYKVIDTPQKFERMIWTFLSGNFYVAWVAHTTGRTGYGRVEGIGMTDGMNSNGTVAVLITSVPILLFYIKNGKRYQQGAALLFLAYIFDATVLINSRGAFVGLVLCFAYFSYYCVFTANKSIGEKLALLSPIVIGGILFLIMSDALFWERMMTLKKVKEGGGGASRIYYWKKTFEILEHHPFGVGVWGYQRMSPRLIPPEYLTKGMRAVHSTYFQALSEYGYMGPVIVGGYLWSVFRLVSRMRKRFKERNESYLFEQIVALASGFVAFLTAAMFIDRLYAEMMYWFPMFIASFYNIYYLKGERFRGEIGPGERGDLG